MEVSKSKKSGRPKPDADLLKSEVASFASSIGLSSSVPSSGFDDSDFRKTSRNKPNPKPPKPLSQHTPTPKTNNNSGRAAPAQNKASRTNQEKPKPKIHKILSVEELKAAADRSKYKNLEKLPLIKASALGVWYEEAAELEAKMLNTEAKKKVEVKNVEEWKSLVEKKKQLAERLLAQYTEDYESSKGGDADTKMLLATQRSGTAADKVSAFSIMVGENPVASLRYLDALLGMITSKIGKRHSLTGFEALRELFISSLLPDRKLKTLFQRPLNHLSDSKDGYSLLLLWYWEDCLKQRYEHFISALEEASGDGIAIVKDKALKTMYALLKSKSEQERRLLTALVNKLGDPANKASSNADFHLSRLLSDHPNMKEVVIEEVDHFLFRPHLGLRAKYYAVNFLSQIRLSNKGDGPKVAKRLMDVYFSLFKLLITSAGGEHKSDENAKQERYRNPNFSKDKKGKNLSESHIELDSRLLSALLTGVNRAFPYVSRNEADDIVEDQTPMLFQLVHSKNFNVGVQALLLLDKISSKNQIVSDRFYRALYSKLLLPAAMNSSKEELFIGLLLRAMKNDVNLKRVAAFSKRLLQVALQQPPQYTCGCLFLLSEVLKARPPLWNMLNQNESVDDGLEHFEDIVDEQELPATSKLETSDNGCEVTHNSMGNSTDSESSSDEDRSPPSDSEDDTLDEMDEMVVGVDLNDPSESKTMADNHNGYQPPTLPLPGGYNPRHREPSYCNANCVSWWELTVLASHVHPSVATMARTLLSGANIVYNGNPLNDLSLTAFLDKFMEKKPKQSTWHGGSQIEPSKQLDMSNHLIGAEILSLAETDVPPEDLVFHKFYVSKMSSSKKSKKKKKKGVEDEAAEDLYAVEGEDESDNEEIENMLDGDPSLMSDADYDYDDLDQVAEEEDSDILVSVSDEEIDIPSDIEKEEEDDTEINDDDDGDVDIGDVDDGGEEERFDQKKRKRKSSMNATATPFASLEDYEHLLNEDGPAVQKPKQKKQKQKRK